MRVHAEGAILAAVLLLVPGAARPQANAPPPGAGSEAAAPEVTPPPAAEPPPDPSGVPNSPGQPQAAGPRTPAGQWVYTQQYGWLWIPYSDVYTSVPPSGSGEPYQYVYSPPLGWTWVVAPWVWGIGPWPYFGVYGPVRFAWYAHGWWRSPWRWHYVAGPYRGYALHGARPFVFGRGVFHGVGPVPRAGFAPRGRAGGHGGHGR